MVLIVFDVFYDWVFGFPTVLWISTYQRNFRLHRFVFPWSGSIPPQPRPVRGRRFLSSPFQPFSSPCIKRLSIAGSSRSTSTVFACFYWFVGRSRAFPYWIRSLQCPLNQPAWNRVNHLTINSCGSFFIDLKIISNPSSAYFLAEQPETCVIHAEFIAIHPADLL